MDWIGAWLWTSTFPLQPPPSPEPPPLPPPDVNVTFQSPPPIINIPPSPGKGAWEIWAQPSATVLAGLAAIGAAGIAWAVAKKNRGQLDDQFEKTHDLDQLRGLRERYTAIGEQLANDSPTVRSAGVYGLSSLADDWLARGNELEAQSCVNLLCSYMRRRFIRDLHADDLDVRDSIVGVISAHLRRDATTSWSNLSFDLRGAHFRRATFGGCVFNKLAAFSNTTFESEYVSFADTRFRLHASFDGAAFHTSTVFFDNAVFQGWVTFSKAKFYADLVNFYQCIFAGRFAGFADALWHIARVDFTQAKFIDGVMTFMGAKPTQVTPDVWPPALYDPPPPIEAPHQAEARSVPSD